VRAELPPLPRLVGNPASGALAGIKEKDGNQMFTRKKRTSLRALICAAALLGVLAVASPALASTARLTKQGVDYTAAPGEANTVSITASNQSWGWSSVIDIADPGATISPVWPFAHLGGCAVNDLRPGEGVVWCVLENDESSIVARLGDLNDRFSSTFRRPTTVSGGAGSDTADYSARSAAVRVTLDGVADDGQASDGDNILADVENVSGGWGDDTLRGSSADNALHGGIGNDGLIGSAGNDHLRGSAGNDVLDGEAAAEMAGHDYLNAGGGDDKIYARDGYHDHIDCGSGIDMVWADPGDYLRDCAPEDIQP
jgi:Ca2+-binding RTX toxin-like protein